MTRVSLWNRGLGQQGRYFTRASGQVIGARRAQFRQRSKAVSHSDGVEPILTGAMYVLGTVADHDGMTWPQAILLQRVPDDVALVPAKVVHGTARYAFEIAPQPHVAQYLLCDGRRLDGGHEQADSRSAEPVERFLHVVVDTRSGLRVPVVVLAVVRDAPLRRSAWSSAALMAPLLSTSVPSRSNKM